MTAENTPLANPKLGVTFHDRCRLGYYDQSLNQLNDNDTLSESLTQLATISDEQSKRALISAGFEYARHGQIVASLSGGERARLLFVGLTLARYHLLFLDEPTNHLDMEGKEELIETLNDFQGASLLVSHDRSLIEQSCNRFWLIKDGYLSEYLSPQEVYEQLSEQSQPTAPQASSASKPSISSAVEDLSSEEQLLERLVELESLLDDDRQRRPKHQKPNLQKQWQDEIESISNQLS
jgi:ATPase subunit of ABC transporter with duplicated ATPase domains